MAIVIDRLVREILLDDTCPACGEVPTGKNISAPSKVLFFEHGGRVETVAWSDGLGQIYVGKQCRIVGLDSIVCSITDCYDTPQNAAVDMCCTHLIEDSHNRRIARQNIAASVEPKREGRTW